MIYCISSLCTERFDCQNNAIPYALIRQIPVATIEIGQCRTFIYIPMMNSVARLSVIFSLTTTTNHFPFPHICNKMLIMDGAFIKSLVQSICGIRLSTAIISLSVEFLELSLCFMLCRCIQRLSSSHGHRATSVSPHIRVHGKRCINIPTQNT